jgi:hypothetical protein
LDVGELRRSFEESVVQNRLPEQIYEILPNVRLNLVLAHAGVSIFLVNFMSTRQRLGVFILAAYLREINARGVYYLAG